MRTLSDPKAALSPRQLRLLRLARLVAADRPIDVTKLSDQEFAALNKGDVALA